MKTRYIFTMGEIQRKDNSIAFKNERGWNYIPVENIRELYFLNEVSLNSKFLDFCAKAGIVLHFFNYYGNYSGTFLPRRHYISGKLTIKQALAYENDRVNIAKAIVLVIAENIYEVLYHYYRHGKKELKEFLDYLKYKIPEFLKKADNINKILFIEGQIWAGFYESISFLHEPQESKFSLSLDLSEAFKPIMVFKTIFELVNRKKLNVLKHFDKRFNYALLNEDGKKIFIKAFEDRINEKFKHPSLKRMVSYNSAIKYDGYKLIKLLLEGREFKPFSLRERK